MELGLQDATNSSQYALEQLSQAIINRDHDTVLSLLKDGISPDSINSRGETPLILAINTGNLLIFHLLLEAGASVNCRNKSGNLPMHAVGYTRHPDAVSMCETLLKLGADPNVENSVGENVMLLASLYGTVSVVELLAPRMQNINQVNRDGRSALHNAAMRNELQMVFLLLKYGADPNSMQGNGETPLILAVRSGHMDVVVILLDAGAEINAKGFMNFTALHWAVQAGHVDLVKYLINRGADVNSTSTMERTPLHRAAALGAHLTHVAHLLIDAGANLELADVHGETPLLTAIRNGILGTVHLLLSYNACTEPNGSSALGKALMCGQTKIALLLVASGCDIAVLRNGSRLSVNTNKDKQRRLLQFMEENRSCFLDPVLLQQQCRTVIKRNLGSGKAVAQRIDQLPLPKLLKSYLSLNDIIIQQNPV